ncbi:MAG: hypothetical protein R3258_09305 [Acidimicrobiia bacterium]|nr:hypothetical protein [Acidimicrobiia bacterium]
MRLLRLLAGVVLASWLVVACTDSVDPATTTASRPAPTSITASPTTTHVEPATTIPVFAFGGPALPDAPAIVADREPLPYCGAEFNDFRTNPYETVEIVDGAAECYRLHAVAGLPAELIEIGITIEGGPLMWIRRLMSDGREIMFFDATRDRFGAMAWVMIECDGYAGSPPDYDRCDDRIVLED